MNCQTRILQQGIQTTTFQWRWKQTLKGLEVSGKNRMKLIDTSPITPKTLATVASGMLLLNRATKAVHTVNTKPHNRVNLHAHPKPLNQIQCWQNTLELTAMYLTVKSCVKQL